jgi:hypothetical protein
MSDRIERIVNAVLYEGYMLYPYRASSVKNRQRWNFGVVVPEEYHRFVDPSERAAMRTECLLEATDATTVDVSVRFLQLVRREVLRSDGEDAADPLEDCDETIERVIALPALHIKSRTRGAAARNAALESGGLPPLCGERASCPPPVGGRAAVTIPHHPRGAGRMPALHRAAASRAMASVKRKARSRHPERGGAVGRERRISTDRNVGSEGDCSFARRHKLIDYLTANRLRSHEFGRLRSFAHSHPAPLALNDGAFRLTEGHGGLPPLLERAWRGRSESGSKLPHSKARLRRAIHAAWRVPIDLPASSETTLAPGQRIVRSSEALAGEVVVEAGAIGHGAFRISVSIANFTPLPADRIHRDVALRRSMLSAHVVLTAHDGAFVSLLDPGDRFRDPAAQCKQDGLYPVLAGEEGDRRCVLASPIILYDHPQVAPESPGNLFDGTEIDEILTLRIQTLSEDEKREIRSADPRTRQLLERADNLEPEMLARLHGVMRPTGESQ